MEEQVMKDAQYRKGMGIAWFNATNSAIEMVKMEQAMGFFSDKISVKGKKAKKAHTIEERIAYWRNHFLEAHKGYYAEVIAKIGAPYKAEDTIARVKKTKDYKELAKLWNSISEDERRDVEIRKAVNELKAIYEKAQ